MSTARKRSTVAQDAQSAVHSKSPEHRCGGCNQIVVSINLLIDGEELTMRSCSICDRRSWHRGGEPVNLSGILADLSSSPTRYRRDLASR